MCVLKDDFLLCSCEPTIRDPDWILERVDPAKPPLHRRGRAAKPRWSVGEEAQIALAARELNSRDCFDFDYTPETDDRLGLKLTGERTRWIFLRYTRRGWVKDTSTSLSSWRTTLKTRASGRVDAGS